MMSVSINLWRVSPRMRQFRSFGAVPVTFLMTSPPGFQTLVEVGMSYVESISPDLGLEMYDQIQQALTSFVRGDLPYDSCSQIFLATIKRDNPLVTIQEILSVSEDPLPYQPTGAPDDSALTLRRKKHPWTSVEDQRLLAGIARFGLDNWQAVAAFVGNGRNRAQCSQRWSRGLNPRISKKGWTVAEEKRLHELVRQYGEKSWAKIASILGNRSDVQCRYHYRQAIQPSSELPTDAIPLARTVKMS